MQKCLLCLSVMMYLLLFSPVFAGDLYLLEITSAGQLQDVRSVVDHANGTIGNKFIVDLTDSQREKLESDDILLQMIAADYSKGRFYLLLRSTPQVSKGAVYFEPKFSAGSDHLVEIDPQNFEILRRDGYMALSIDRLETPFFFMPPAVTAPFLDSYPLDTLVGLVRQDSLYNYIDRLQAFQTRYLTTDSVLKARDWLVSKFQEFGYADVRTDTLYVGQTACHNVICFKPGTDESNKIIVIGAHYDSYNGDSPTEIFAPGADDNASGTAVILELARIFKDVDLKKSILFVAFSAEEVGLFGSNYMAQTLYQQGADVECMLNFDMDSYTADEYDDMSIFYDQLKVYGDVMASSATRLTSLYPVFPTSGIGGSDNASFGQFGFQTSFAEEGDFNYPGWHHDIDVITTLDFPYFTELVKMAVGAVGQIDVAANATEIKDVWDIGDGNSLRLVWESCESNYDYKIAFGSSPGIYTDTIQVPPHSCFFDLTGLSPGITYYFTVLPTTSDGYGPIYFIESSGMPLIMPRSPAGVKTEPNYHEITVTWNRNMEFDLSHYELFRKTSDGSWMLHENDLVDTSYVDHTAFAHVVYSYFVKAIDYDQNESDSSIVVKAMAATFDYPFLFVDETDRNGFTPAQSAQMAFYDSIFAGQQHDLFVVGTSTTPPDRIDRMMAGQYRSMLWADDDYAVHRFSGSQDTIAWYLKFNTDFCLSGWQTMLYIAGTLPQQPGDFVYNNFGIAKVTVDNQFDFIGAAGQNGWPDLVVRSNTGILNDIAIFDTIPGSEVIYTFNSSPVNPDFEGKPAGVLYSTGNVKRIALSFPIYHMTEASAQAFMAKLYDCFGIESGVVHGDIDNSGIVNILDIAYLIRYIYLEGFPPADMNMADPDGNCGINLLDVTYLVNYLYRGGPLPLPGCVE